MTKYRYGLPYVGSKSRICDRLIEHLPECENFVDVFAGGCAVTHAMIRAGKVHTCYINDLQGQYPSLFISALSGNLRDRWEWVSREDFGRHRTDDAWVALAYAFGNNTRYYLYNPIRETYMRACHRAIVYDDWADFTELCPECAAQCRSRLSGDSDIPRRRLLFTQEIVKVVREITGNTRKSPLLDDNALYRSIKRPYRKGTGGVDGYSHLAIQHLQNIERIRELYSPININIHASSMDYRGLTIPRDAVVFCDPPYQSSDVKYTDSFDYGAFIEWCVETAKHNPVFVTEYKIDHPRFREVADFPRQISLSSATSFVKSEKLYRVV